MQYQIRCSICKIMFISSNLLDTYCSENCKIEGVKEREDEKRRKREREKRFKSKNGIKQDFLELRKQRKELKEGDKPT